jgi:hypothetical protein
MNKLHTLLAVVWLLLEAPLAAQSPEAPAEINVLTYTNSNYHHHDGYQQWIYSPTESRTGGGYLRTHDIARFHRYGGGYHSNFWANHSFAVGEDPYEYYHEYRNATAWFGPLPTTAVWASYSTNYWWWPWMANAETSAYSDGGVHTDYSWSPPESRKAHYTEDVPNWTLIFHWGAPHQGYFEKWTNGTTVDTTLELFSGGASNSTADVTMQLNVWAYDNLRGRWLTWNEIGITVGAPPTADTSWLRFGPGGTGTLTLTPDSSDNVFLLMQDNQRAQITFSFNPTNALPTNLPPGAVEDVSFYAWPARHHLLVGVDKNRDGSIELDGTNDLTSAASPYVFWVNNDTDRFEYDSNGNITNQRDFESGTRDFDETLITSPRDLEDYTRLNVRLPLIDYLQASWQVRLTYSGQVKLFRTQGAGFEYVSSAPALDAAYWECRYPFPVVLGTNTYPNIYGNFGLAGDNAPLNQYLLTAGSTGPGTLTVELIQNGNVVGRKRAYFDFRDIQTFYDHYTVGDTTQRDVPVPAAASPLHTSQYPALTNEYVMFVHGWRMQPLERRRFAETMFKRLWWQGYKGRFGLFSWPTEWVDSSTASMLLDPLNFNRSERQAWMSGSALHSLVKSLNLGAYSNQVRVAAHSMGNVVVAEALRLATDAGDVGIVHTYLAMQGAFPAHAYDATRPNRTSPFVSQASQPNVYGSYWVPGRPPYAANVLGAVNSVNFWNPLDYALDKWCINHDVTRPVSPYAYTASNWFFEGYPSVPDIVYRHLGFPANKYEIFPFCAMSFSWALGAQGGVAGPFLDEADLDSSFGFGNLTPGHSKQFYFTIADLWPFWDLVYQKFDLTR